MRLFLIIYLIDGKPFIFYLIVDEMFTNYTIYNIYVADLQMLYYVIKLDLSKQTVI